MDPRERPSIPDHLNRPGAGFDAFDLHPDVRRAVADAGYERPRPIQAETIGAALNGRDILGLAQTGTGKTAAFAIPILDRLLDGRRGGPRALVLAPTRELARQIQVEFDDLSRHTRLWTTTVFGGAGAEPQIRALRERPDVLVACPGRLLDLIQRRAVRFDRLETLVIDEADRMFDMGFLPDIRRILGHLPRDRQTMLFSATMPREIRALTGRVLARPHVVELAHSAPARSIEHAMCPVAASEKSDVLFRLLSRQSFTSAIVFLRTKHRAKRLARQLEQLGHRAVALQGNMSQSARDRAMAGFRDGVFNVLVATDIAARGLDVAHVSDVINFDVPGTPDAYTHRIGRTGRSEKSGRAVTFITPEDEPVVAAIERAFGAVPRMAAPQSAPGDPTAPARARPRRPRGSRPSGAPGRRRGRARRKPRARGERPLRS